MMKRDPWLDTIEAMTRGYVSARNMRFNVPGEGIANATYDDLPDKFKEKERENIRKAIEACGVPIRDIVEGKVRLIPVEPERVDDIIDGYSGDEPECLIWFLLINRLPASLKLVADSMGCKPTLFADHEGQRVRVVMASRLGDVGITRDLTAEHGYEKRVDVAELENFSATP